MCHNNTSVGGSVEISVPVDGVPLCDVYRTDDPCRRMEALFFIGGGKGSNS